MIYAFCIAAHVCGESTAHWWIPLQAINSAELCCLINVLMSCWTNCRDSSEKNRETHIILYCYGNRHSKIDDITGSQGITGVELCWSNMTGFHRRWYPSQKVGLIFSFMFAWTNCYTNCRVASGLKSHDAYAMSLLCVICQSDIPHGWTSGSLRRSHIKSIIRRIRYKKHRFHLRDKQITCDHGCAKLDF